MGKFVDRFWDVKSFDELRKYCRQSNDFCKDVCAILTSRSKLEITYGENLAQLAIKASKCGKDLVGSLKTAWTSLVSEIESEAEIHKDLAGKVNDEAVKELKSFLDNQLKTRKPVEQQVEKSVKLYTDKRTDEQKAKKSSHLRARDYENTMEQFEDAKSGKKKVVTEKELSKLEAKCKKAASNVEKADREYKDFNLKAERGRIELSSAIRRFSQVCETTELERVQHLKDLFVKYSEMLEGIIPQKQKCYSSIKNESSLVDPYNDVESVADQRGTEREAAEQTLTDYYEEDLQNTMDVERRRKMLEEKVRNHTIDLKRETKAREGIAHLFNVYETTPNYSDEEGTMNVAEQLTAADEVINSLDGSLYKLKCALAEVNGQQPLSHRLSSYIQTVKDKQGLVQSFLKIPPDEVSTAPSNSDFTDNVVENYASDNEFDDSYAQPGYIGQCAAVYDYDATQSDELTIRSGDVIDIVEKQDSDWWLGHLNGRTGIFPAMYVEEMK
ncbi:nostrin-like [Xenia sp. Carnegie-2017]|uniref:nostrin-like n=1 Tax=Xenia sp. Carnegie-2017 TaxID=2897299 RepID=UPI001F03F127|nr:nostrin-like [Xenia sp. Carnegie-2017]